MKKAIHSLCVFLCLAMLLMATSACGSSDTSSPAPGGGSATEGGTAEQTKFVIATYLTESDGLESNIWYKYSKAYTEANPNVVFDIFTTDADTYNNKIMTMLAGGDQVDIFWPHTIPMYVQFIQNGYVHELNSFAEADGLDLKEAFHGIEEAVSYSDGKIYGFPFAQHVWGIFYNKDMFDAKGVEYPKNGMTWEEYGEIMQKMTYGEGASKVYGGHFQDWPNCVQNIATGSGLHTSVEDNVDYSFMKYAYDLVLGWQDAGYIMDYSVIQSNSLSYHSLFLNQNIATLYNGTWEIPALVASAEKGDLKFEWGICQAPYNAKEGGQPGNAVGAVNLAVMNSKTANPQEAYNFIKWIATSEDAAKVAISTGSTPIQLSDEILSDFIKNPGVPEDVGQVYEKTTFVLEAPMSDDAGTAETILNEEHSLIMTGNISAEEGLAEATRRMEEARAQ